MRTHERLIEAQFDSVMNRLQQLVLRKRRESDERRFTAIHRSSDLKLQLAVEFHVIGLKYLFDFQSSDFGFKIDLVISPGNFHRAGKEV